MRDWRGMCKTDWKDPGLHSKVRFVHFRSSKVSIWICTTYSKKEFYLLNKNNIYFIFNNIVWTSVLVIYCIIAEI